MPVTITPQGAVVTVNNVVNVFPAGTNVLVVPVEDTPHQLAQAVWQFVTSFVAAGDREIMLPEAPVDGDIVTVSGCNGDESYFPITITTPAGPQIQGYFGDPYQMVGDYSSVTFQYESSNGVWTIVSETLRNWIYVQDASLDPDVVIPRRAPQTTIYVDNPGIDATIDLFANGWVHGDIVTIVVRDTGSSSGTVEISSGFNLNDYGWPWVLNWVGASFSCMYDGGNDTWNLLYAQPSYVSMDAESAASPVAIPRLARETIVRCNANVALVVDTLATLWHDGDIVRFYIASGLGDVTVVADMNGFGASQDITGVGANLSIMWDGQNGAWTLLHKLEP